MRHPAYGKAWQHFDEDNVPFVADPRNLRLGFAIDGFNPFGHMSSTYSTWPVFLIPYNFPPWMCMDQSNFMMALLILGKYSPGKDFHVFMQPLIHDLKKLWCGVPTKDVLENEVFNLRAAILWTIHDYPAYGTTAGRNIKGYYACVSCDKNPCHVKLKNKFGHIGHRRFLDDDHTFRSSYFVVEELKRKEISVF